MVLGQKQFETDNGAGAVLCVWAVYLEVQATVSVCKLPRTETDDAIDAAILSMDDFIEANSSLHPTAEMLRDFKARAVAHIVASPQFCSSHDIEGFRSVSAEEIRGGVDRLLAVPREPVMNPCL